MVKGESATIPHNYNWTLCAGYQRPQKGKVWDEDPTPKLNNNLLMPWLHSRPQQPEPLKVDPKGKKNNMHNDLMVG